jgi:hypothetical protein
VKAVLATASRATGDTSPAGALVDGLEPALCAAVVGLGAVAALTIPRRRRRQPAEVEVLQPALDEAA